jgi:hypothetical protein
MCTHSEVPRSICPFRTGGSGCRPRIWSRIKPLVSQDSSRPARRAVTSRACSEPTMNLLLFRICTGSVLVLCHCHLSSRLATQPAAMDSKMPMPEILDAIFSHLAYCPILPGRFGCGAKDLAALARTCKTFRDPALDILWSRQQSLTPALRCLPDDLLLWDRSGESKKKGFLVSGTAQITTCMKFFEDISAACCPQRLGSTAFLLESYQEPDHSRFIRVAYLARAMADAPVVLSWR